MTKQELTANEVANIVARTCPVENYRGKKVLLIVPDATRTAPVGLLFKTIHAQSAGAVLLVPKAGEMLYHLKFAVMGEGGVSSDWFGLPEPGGD